ncbi:hypothetical protein HIM_05816 [Hirsutella minnesotensis 3608]|uniref:F-box domain-containing protein n=1 Tax=Hirsutella minnesotensis 3608 TaxID=1043627 RepID=A0A0F8A547_9HYPO|nr:hypothetical protein HIM_05816 [Hirsutella minnesotensis 3608]
MIQPSCALRTLAVPEILINIFECLLHDAASMRAAICVAKHWFTCGTDVLWRRAPCEALAALPQARRQVYASKITSLAFSGDEESEYHALFRNLELSSLREVSIDAYHPESGGLQLRQYLQPPLESFAFYGGDLDDSLLQRLQTTCWRLKRILIDSPGSTITASSFLEFVSGCKHLEQIDLLHGVHHLLNDDLLVHLAQRPNLVSLGVGKEWTPQLIHHISTIISRPFPSLRTLDVAISSETVPSLVSLIGGVTKLGLDVKDGQGDVISPIATLQGLRRLDLSFGAPKELSRDEILALKNLSRLEDLIIGPTDSDDAGNVTAFNTGFSNKDFDELVSSLRLLRHLNFMIQCDLSYAVVLSLAKHCPLLEECTMPQVLDFEGFRSEAKDGVVLPKLQVLDLGGVRPIGQDEPQTSPEELISLMRSWFPRLQEMYVSSDDDFSEVVASAFTVGEDS